MTALPEPQLQAKTSVKANVSPFKPSKINKQRKLDDSPSAPQGFLEFAEQQK